MANVSKAQIKEKLSKMYKCKEDQIAIFGLKTKFGGGRSSGFALVYNSLDAKKKLLGKNLKKRVSLSIFQNYIIKQDGLLGKPEKTRKQKKEIKGRVKKVRGIQKAKVAAAGGKKKK